MKSTIAGKQLLSFLFDILGVVRWKLKAVHPDAFVILMYHRVLPPKHTIDVEPGMYVTPRTFNIHLSYLKRYFRVVSINEIVDLAKNEKIGERGKPLCVLTFDDGWQDFYKYAFPVLNKHKLPATVFLPTDFIGTDNLFWTDRLAQILALEDLSLQADIQTGSFNKNIILDCFKKLHGAFETRLEKTLNILKKFNEDEIEEALLDLSSRLQLTDRDNDRVFLNWDEVKELSGSGFITFGSHTASHKILTTLNDEEILQELTKSRDTLISQLAVDPNCIPFCYPNGNFNPRIAEMVKNSGYALAVTTKKGWNDQDTDLFTLRRIGLHQDISSTRPMFSCRITSIF